MNEYTVKPSAKADINALVESLSALRIPISDTKDGRVRIVRIGPDADFEVRQETMLLGRTKTTLHILYEQPVLKKVVSDWIDKCGLEVHEDFYKWHMNLSPSVLRGIKARWRVDLTGMPVTPVKMGQIVVVFMFGGNVTTELAAQLASMPHRAIAPDEFIECDDFVVKGDDPLDTVVYGWRSDAGSQLFAVTASAPALTMLSLWVISDGAAAKHNIKELPN